MRKIRHYLHKWRSRRYWRQFKSEGKNASEHLVFARENLSDNQSSLWDLT